MTFEDKTHQELRKEILILRESGKAIIKSEMERTQEVIRLRDVQYYLVLALQLLDEYVSEMSEEHEEILRSALKKATS